MTPKQPHPLTRLTMRMLPFSDAVSDALPFGQLLRLSLFQISVGMASVMLLGTLNRVMIVELGVGAMIVACMIIKDVETLMPLLPKAQREELMTTGLSLS